MITHGVKFGYISAQFDWFTLRLWFGLNCRREGWGTRWSCSIIEPMQRIVVVPVFARLSKISLFVPESLRHEFFLQHCGNMVETGILQCLHVLTVQTQCPSDFTECYLDMFHTSSVRFVYRSYVKKGGLNWIHIPELVLVPFLLLPPRS